MSFGCAIPNRKTRNLSHLLAFHQPSFDFKEGDKLSFKDEGGNAVMHIESITYQCTGIVPILPCILVNMSCAPQRSNESAARRRLLTMRSPRVVVACVVVSVLKHANRQLLPRNVKPLHMVLPHA